VLFTSRTALAGALVLGSVLALGVPAAAAPALSHATAASAPEPDGRADVLVSITAPQQVERGEAATLGVTVRDFAVGTPVAGTLVVLLRRATGEGGWAEADRTVTDPDGRAILHAVVLPPATDFKARVPATDDHRKGRSARVTVTTR
jgi:DMSO/TMAO reductase YedYZ molybdopterin-dependent catalytic subunit